MFEAASYLAKGSFGIESDGNIAPLVAIRRFDDICQRSGTKFESDVEEVGVRFLVVVANDVGMIVAFLEDINFAGSKSHKILE